MTPVSNIILMVMTPLQLGTDWLDEQEKAHLKFEEQHRRILPPPPSFEGAVEAGAPVASLLPLFGKESEMTSHVPPALPQPNYGQESLPATPISPTNGPPSPPRQQPLPPMPPTPLRPFPSRPATRWSACIQSQCEAYQANSAVQKEHTDYVVNCCAFITAMPEPVSYTHLTLPTILRV